MWLLCLEFLSCCEFLRKELEPLSEFGFFCEPEKPLLEFLLEEVPMDEFFFDEVRFEEELRFPDRLPLEKDLLDFNPPLLFPPPRLSRAKESSAINRIAKVRTILKIENIFITITPQQILNVRKMFITDVVFKYSNIKSILLEKSS